MTISDFVTFVKSKKYYIILISVVLLFFLLRMILLRTPSTDISYTVKQEDLVDTVQVSGTYTTASQTQVVSPTNGIITQLYVNNNEYVKKGDPLFHAESSATVDQQKAAYANYQAAISALQTAQQNKTGFQSQLEQDRQAVITASSNVTTMQNNRNTGQNNPVTKLPYTQDDIDAITSALTSSRETFSKDEQKYLQAGTPIEAAQAQVTNTKQLSDETQSVTVTAPLSGTVVNLLAKVGDQISAPQPLALGNTTVTSPAQPVLMVANLGDPYITADISEDYATRIESGQKATIVFDALKEQTFSGTVDTVATVGTNTQGTVTYAARIIVNTIPAIIKPNMTALVTIETLRKNNVITIPNSALITKEGADYVEQVQSHKLIPVQTGTKGTAKTEIVTGLTSGTTIVANP